MRVKVFCLIAALLVLGTAVSADVLWYQPVTQLIPAASSQAFPDLNVNTRAFDDFTTGGLSWIVTRVTVYGSEMATAPSNEAVKMAFTTAPDAYAIGITFDGVQVGQDLIFDMPGPVILSGDFWLTAWVERPSTGYQWFWHISGPVTGSQFYWHNPDNYFGLGADPIPGENLLGLKDPVDLAFKIEGRLGCETVIPEAPSLLLALSALPAVVAAARLRGSRRG